MHPFLTETSGPRCPYASHECVQYMVGNSTSHTGPVGRLPAVKILAIWLHCARDYPLSIGLLDGLNFGVSRVLGRYTKQLKNLVIQVLDEIGSLSGIRPFPCSETLTLTNFPSDDRDYSPIRLAQVVGILCNCLNLVECTLKTVSTCADEETTEILVLPRLLTLRLDENAFKVILDHLSLPVEQTLSFPPFNDSSIVLTRFLERSSSVLRMLTLSDDKYRSIRV
ncbi:hypothetical protein MVEN_01672900 [Mycena venus]|uniref:Uncharacterized protein n=1 Tax=Mycena venus TaxID=2733690 RepID=A0A8H6XNM4_9AGAR|nr:hypothetical protein MVEN_01672900 [Mycena venus]